MSLYFHSCILLKKSNYWQSNASKNIPLITGQSQIRLRNKSYQRNGWRVSRNAWGVLMASHIILLERRQWQRRTFRNKISFNSPKWMWLALWPAGPPQCRTSHPPVHHIHVWLRASNSKATSINLLLHPLLFWDLAAAAEALARSATSAGWKGSVQSVSQLIPEVFHEVEVGPVKLFQGKLSNPPR